MGKRGIALFLATMLIASLSVPGLAAVNPFSDLSSDHWAYDSVVTLAAAGLIEGYPDGTFGGERTFTRYEMAMVFARILARFERLIDDKIEDGIQSQTADLEAQIQATRDELVNLITERYDELRDALLRAGIPVGSDDGDSAAGTFVGGPRAALAELISDELAERLQDLASQRDVDELARMIVGIEGGLSDLERRMLQLEGSTPTRAEAELIAERAIAAALADRDREIRAALGAAQGDTSSLSELIDAKIDEILGHMDALANEFRNELNTLGVRVDVLEKHVAEHDERISTVERQLGGISLSGGAELFVRHTGVTGDAPYLRDPRDSDSYEFKAGNEFENRLTLGIAAQPAENVDVKAELVFKDMFGLNSGLVEPGINLELTTPGVLRSLHMGEFDLIEQSVAFDKFTLNPKAAVFDVDPEDEASLVRGADINLVYGLDDSTNINAFISRVDNAEYLIGAAATYTLSDAFDLAFRGVRQGNAPEAGNPSAPYEFNATYSVESQGTLDNITYSALYAQHAAKDAGVNRSGRAAEGWAEMPLYFATARLEAAAVGSNFYPLYGKELDSTKIAGTDKHLPSGGLDWLEREIAPTEDLVAQGERDIRASLAAPLLGADATLAFGHRRDGAGSNNYSQIAVEGLEFAAIDIGLLFDRRVNGSNEEDNVARATFDTTILGADVRATIHNRTNDQSWIPNPVEAEQSATWLTARHSLDIGVPLAVEAHYGINEIVDSRASRLKLATEYPYNDLTLRAAYQVEANAIGKITDDVELNWWKNEPWTTKDRDSIAVGFDYTIRELFGTDVLTGFEHRLVREDGTTYGTARNTFTASFEKALRGGEALLEGQAKYVTGGNVDEDEDRVGNDLVAKIKLTYPVFDGADLSVGGEWVSSSGGTSNEYDVFRFDAGFKMDF